MAKKKYKRPEIACPTCKAANPLGHAFCVSCGGRLYQQAGQPQKILEKKRGGAGRASRNALRALLLIALLAALGFALWPQEVPGQVGSAADKAAGQKAVKGCARAIRAGVAGQFNISEAQVNALLEGYGGEELEDDAKPYSELLQEELRVRVTDNEVVLTSLERFGHLGLSFRAVYGIDPEQQAWLPLRAFLGHLPLPKQVANLFAEKVARRFGVDEEISVVEHSRPVRVKNGVIALKLLPAAAK